MNRDQAHPVAPPARGSWAALLWASRQFDYENGQATEDQIDEFMALKSEYEFAERRKQLDRLARSMERLVDR